MAELLPTDLRLESLSVSDILNMTLLGDESFYRCAPVDAEIERLEKARSRDHEQAWMNGAAALRLRTAIETHNVECLSLCNDKKDCGYAQYKNRRCTHCPAEWLIELPAHDVMQEFHNLGDVAEIRLLRKGIEYVLRNHDDCVCRYARRALGELIKPQPDDVGGKHE